MQWDALKDVPEDGASIWPAGLLLRGPEKCFGT